MTLKLATAIVLSLALVTALATSAAAQQKRQTPVKQQPAPAPTPAPTPPPTFDTLIPANSYRLYGEVRSVGQLIQSNSVNEILEPILKLAGPPKGFRTVIKWLTAHADEVTTSRLLVAAWAPAPELPDTLVAVEFASAEEAAKFQQQLNDLLGKVLPPTPALDGETNKTPPRAQYHIQQAGSLLLITSTPLDFKKLRPAGSKWLSEEVNFRVARNRFNTEPIFIFVDVAEIKKEEQKRMKQYEEQRQKALAENAAKQTAEPPNVELDTEPEETPPPPVAEPGTIVGVETKLEGVSPSQPPPPAPAPGAQDFLFALSMVMTNFSAADAKYPDAVGVAISLEGESFDVRALLVNAPGEKSDPLPFLPVLSTGPAITPDAPNVLPADTEMLVTMSLDLPHIHTAMSKPRPIFPPRGQDVRIADVGAIESPFAALERQLKIKIKDDLLPLIGSEIAVSLPVTGLGFIAPPSTPLSTSATPSPSASPSASPSPSPNDNASAAKPSRHVAVAISLKDKEGMRALLPKLIESLAFKGANAFAQTERREDTELVSYANIVSYAFIGNFLLISPDVATTRHVVDSYLKRQTLAGDMHFKNYTRWQPRQLHGQVYVSQSLMESYRTWIQQPNSRVDEQTRAYLSRFTVVPEPVTYSLSNEGFGPLHELHLPKNLVLLLIAAINAPPYHADPPTGPNPAVGPAVKTPVIPDPN